MVLNKTCIDWSLTDLIQEKSTTQTNVIYYITIIIIFNSHWTLILTKAFLQVIHFDTLYKIGTAIIYIYNTFTSSRKCPGVLSLSILLGKY